MTVLEQQVLETVMHNTPEIEKQLERIADGIEAFKKLVAKSSEGGVAMENVIDDEGMED